MEKKKLGLVPKLIIAIILGILFGQFLPESICRVVVTASGLFSTVQGFLSERGLLGNCLQSLPSPLCPCGFGARQVEGTQEASPPLSGAWGEECPGCSAWAGRCCRSSKGARRWAAAVHWSRCCFLGMWGARCSRKGWVGMLAEVPQQTPVVQTVPGTGHP